MKVTKEKTENSQAFLTVEMEPEEVEEFLEKSYHRLVRKAKIPGFRKGKAPRAILERHIGRESLLEDALNSLVPQSYEKALNEQGIEAFAQPQIEISQTDPVVFKATVPLAPVAELGDYHHIQVTPQSVELTEDNVNAVVEHLRHQHATWEPVERPVEFNALIGLNVVSEIEGEAFINQEGAQYQVVQNQPMPVPGFAEQLIGMKMGEEKEFKLTLPSDYPRNELAGKEASFKVEVSEVKEERLPELDADFAKQVDPDFKTMDSLRERVSTDLKLRAEEKARVEYEERVVEAVIDLTKLEFPPILVETEIDRMLNEQAQRLRAAGKDLEEYLGNINKTEAELREELRSLATKRVGSSLVLSKVAEEENIEVSDAEIDVEIESMKEDTAENKDELQKFLNAPQRRKSIERLLIARKTVQRLVEIANGSNTNIEVKQKEEQE